MEENLFTKWAYILTLIGVIIEGCLSIPISGGLFVILTGYSILFFTGIIHMANLILRVLNQKNLGETKQNYLVAPIVGIVAALLGSVFLLGWGLHVATAILLAMDLMHKNYAPVKDEWTEDTPKENQKEEPSPIIEESTNKDTQDHTAL